MVERRRMHPAVKHGAYTATGLLPGESRAEFEKLHQELISEFAPDGASENDIVTHIAYYTWRKRNLATVRRASSAQARFAAIKHSVLAQSSERAQSARESGPKAMSYPVMRFEESPKGRDAIEAATDQAREEFGDSFALVEIGESATMSGLRDELELHERLDALIERCFKRLLLVRGVKSVSSSSEAASKPVPRLVSRRT
jgi:hypothetical protein